MRRLADMQARPRTRRRIDCIALYSRREIEVPLSPDPEYNGLGMIEGPRNTVGRPGSLSVRNVCRLF